MTTLFYLLGYLGVIGFAVTSFLKIKKYVKTTPLHCRWEIYPIPHEGARAKHGGSYMEESNWWTKEHHVDHMGDLKALLMEVLFLESTFHNNRTLWYRTYPFHFGLYMLMGGAIILFITAFLRLFGMSADNGLISFIYWLINVMSLLGCIGLIGGGIGLIFRRMTDKGLRMYTTTEHLLSIGLFVLFGVTGLAVWCTNPSFAPIASDYMYNLVTFKIFTPLQSGGFCLHMLVGDALLILIPVSFMSHILLKYFFYHDIRWEDVATPLSTKIQGKILNALKFHCNWAAPHINPEQDPNKTWVDVATTGYPCQDNADKK